jgi:hypothetical protein
VLNSCFNCSGNDSCCDESDFKSSSNIFEIENDEEDEDDDELENIQPVSSLICDDDPIMLCLEGGIE